MKTLKEITTAKIYANEEVLATAPRNKVQGELEFFNLDKYVTDVKLEKEYESRGLVPADLYALANWNEEHKDDERRYFATHWKDAQGKWCFAAFGRWRGGRRVRVSRYDGGWGGGWWFAGLRKSTQKLDTKTSALEPTLDLDLAIKICKDAGYKIFKEIV